MKSKSKLKQFIKEETFNVKLDRARNNLSEAYKEIEAAKQLHEKKEIAKYYVKSLVEPGYKPEIGWDTVNKDKESKFLQAMGGKPFPLGNNLHGIELDVKAGGSQDKLWFYDYNEVWTTNQTRSLGYSIKSDKIMLFNKPGGTTTVGQIKLVGGKATFELTDAERAEIQAQTKEDAVDTSTIDTIQTILDWAGFIPVIGDFIDGINALIYFLRKKWFEGFLSLIAIIPIIGSGIKVGVKGTLKATGLAKVGPWIKKLWYGEAKYADKIWNAIAAGKAVSPAELKIIGNGLEGISKMTRRTTAGVRKIPFINTKPAIKQMEAFDNFIKNSVKSVDDLQAGAKATSKIVPDLQKAYRTGKRTPTNIINFIPRTFVKLTGRPLRRIRKLPFFPASKIERLAVGIEKGFAKDMLKTPEKLTGLWTYSFKNPKIRKEVEEKMLNRLSKLKPNEQTRIYNLLGDSLELGNPRNVNQFFSKLKGDPVGKELYNSLGMDLISHAKNTDSMPWVLYKSNNLNNLKTVMSKDMINGPILKQIEVSFAKNADVIWNELQEVGETLGLKNKREVNGIILPTITAATAEFLPGTYKQGLELKKYVDSDEVQDIIGGIKGVGTATLRSFGYDPEQYDAYNPEGEAIDAYNPEGESISSDKNK